MLLLSAQTLKAQLQNIPCTGYTVDVVANGAATSQASTTGDIDASGYVFIDNTFNPGSGICNTSGIWNTSMPTSGTSALTYTLQSASTNNALQVVPNSSGILTVTTPVSVNNLYVLALGGGGTCTINVTVTFSDQSTQVFTGLTAQDWCTGSSPVTSQFYRTLRSSATTCSTALCPYMYELSLPIYSTNQYRTIASISFSNAIGTGFLNVFAIGGYVLPSPPSCSTPSAQPTGLTLTPGATNVVGSFTAASGADSYLIVRSTASTLSTSPINGTTYSNGGSLGGGTVVSYQSSTSFTDNVSITQNTQYYYYVFSANSNCTGGPNYLTTSPSNSTTTTNNTAIYTSSGTWTCPPSVTSIQVECWGAGGGGGYGGTSGTYYGGGGGGGGAYKINSSVAVTPGIQYPIAVGSFGAAGLISVSAGDGGAGGATSFGGTTVVANGGAGGKSYGNGAAGGAGGTGGTYNGGNGSAGSTTHSGGGGGGAGSTGNGGAASSSTAGVAGSGIGGGIGGGGTTNSYTAGSFASQYGGGGGGGTSSSDGGGGAGGAVIITLPCITPSSQPTVLSLTPNNTTVAGSFTSASPGGNSYLVVCTTTASQPTNPANGTTYTVGASALGGVIISSSSSTSFTASGLSTNTQYWFWIYSFNNLCTGGPIYLTTSPLSGNSTTLSTKTWVGKGSGGSGTDFNTAANWSPATVPSTTDVAVITVTSSATITLSSSITVGYLNITNNATGAVTLALDATTKTFTINNDLTANINASGGSSTILSLRVGNSPGAIIVKGNTYLGTNGNTSSYLEFNGSGGNSSSGTVTFKGNVTFGGTYYPTASGKSIATMIWDGTGNQTITTNNSRTVLLNANCLIGSTNTPTVIVSNTYSQGLNTYNSGNNLTVSAGSTLDLTTNSWNQNAATGTLTVNGTLKLAGSSGGQTGSNFPLNYATTTLASTSTVEYNAIVGVNQTIYNTPYGNLTISTSGIKTLAAATTVNNNLAISGSATLACDVYQITGNATGTMTMAAGTTLNLGNTGSATAVSFPTAFTQAHITLNNASTVVYQSTGAQTVSATPSSYGYLTCQTGGTKTLANAIAVNNTLTIGSSTTLADGGYTLTEKGNVTNNGTHSGTGKIYLNGGSAQHTVTSTGSNTFAKIEVNDSYGALFTNTAGTAQTTTIGTLTLTAGNVTVGSFSNSSNLTVTNAVTVPSTVTLGFNATNGGTMTFSGDLSISSGGTWSCTATNNFALNGNATNSGTWTDASYGTYTLAGSKSYSGYNTMNMPNIRITNYNPTLQGQIFNSGSFYTTQAFSMNNSYAYNGGTGTVLEINGQSNTGWPYLQAGGSSCIIKMSGSNSLQQVGNCQQVLLVVNKSAGTARLHTSTSTGSFANGFTLTNGTLDCGVFSMNAYGGTSTISSGASLIIKKDGTPYFYNAVFASNSTITIDSICNNIAQSTTYGNLTIQGTSRTVTGQYGVTVAGTFTLGSGVTFSENSQSIIFNGGFTNNGTYSANATATFSGSSSQTIGGTTATAFNNVTIQNSAGVSLSNNISVAGTLTMTTGLLATSTYYVDLGSAGSISEANPSALAPTSYVVGTVKATRNTGSSSGNVTFGNLGVELTETTKSNNSTLVVRVTGTACTANGKSGIKRYFTITPSNDVSLNGTLVFHYFNAELNGCTVTNLKLYKSTNSRVTWSTQSSALSASTNTLTLSGITSFSDWTASDYINDPLPIELTSFTATKQHSDVEINWQTASETNNDYFTLERSTDGVNWNVVYECSGAGTSTLAHSYSFVDNETIDGTVYYRLKQTDINGDFSYSTIVSVTEAQNSALSVNVYPIPSKGVINISISDNTHQSVSSKITNTLGEKLFSSDTFQPSIDLTNLPDGIYYVAMKIGTTTVVKPIIIRK